MENALPSLWERLQQDGPESCLIARILEGDDVVRVAIDRLGKFARWKDVLRQIEDGDVAMMRVLGEEVQNTLVPPSFFHQIVQHQDSPIGLFEPLVQMRRGGNAFEESDGRLHRFEPGLPSVVGIDHLAGFALEDPLRVGEEILHQDGFSATGGTRHDHARRLSYHFVRRCSREVPF